MSFSGRSLATVGVLLVIGAIALIEALGAPAPFARTRVPSFVGMRTSDAILTAAQVHVHVRFVQVVDDPLPVEGVVVAGRAHPDTGSGTRWSSSRAPSAHPMFGAVPHPAAQSRV